MLPPNRKPVKQACTPCRKKRAKCDNQAPCERCLISKEKCIYEKNKTAANDDLRAEVDRLKMEQNTNKTLIQALINNDTRQTVLDGLKQGTSGELLINRLSTTGSLVQLAEPTNPVASHSVSENSLVNNNDTGLYAYHLQSSESSPRPSPSAGQEPLGNLEAGVAAGHSLGPWLETWEVSLIEHLLNYVLDENFMPLRILSKTHFLHDYIHEKQVYCSPALINAVLAFSCQMISVQVPQFILFNIQPTINELFFSRAQGQLLHLGLSPPSLDQLPELQAVGFLALHEVANGGHRQARRFAEAFLDSSIQLCRRLKEGDIEDMDYAMIRSETFCSAVWLLRIINLCVNQLSNPPEAKLWPQSSVVATCGQAEFTKYQQLHVNGCKDIRASLFRLTEWVCQLVQTARHSGGQSSDEELLECYSKCLNWYEGFLIFAKTEQSPVPFILFVHIYYHFCMICLFRPYFNRVTIDDSNISPHEVCDQAAQTIIRLTQTYSRLYSLRQVCGFVPYIVYTACTVQLANGSELSSVLRDPLGARASGSSLASSPPNAWYIDYSDEAQRHASVHVSDARLLLADMASTHKFAAEAGRLARDRVNAKNEKNLHHPIS